MLKKLIRWLGDKNHKVILILLAFAVFLTLNQFYNLRITRKNKAPGVQIIDLKAELKGLSDQELAAAQAYIKFKKIKSSFIPSGVPEIYGEELGISFDKVQEAINTVQVFGPTYGDEEKKLVLEGADLERYKEVGASIACEYCCGVKTLTQEDGTAACGCAHSIMMRGLAAYLINNHPEISNQGILDELTKWKITYFPKQTLSAELQALEKQGEPGIKEILNEFPDFLPEMVGGC